MKTWMVLMALMLLLVLWAGMAWAGDDVDWAISDAYSTNSVVLVDKTVLKELLAEAQREGASLNVAVYEYDEKRDMWDRARPAPCLDKMEAAMLAMDRFMPTVVMYDALNLIKNPAPDTRQWLKNFLVIAENAEKEWTEAKACWRKP